VRVVGQEDMKLALMLNVVDSRIGGVLVMGDRGTGKSVAVRLPACRSSSALALWPDGAFSAWCQPQHAAGSRRPNTVAARI